MLVLCAAAGPILSTAAWLILRPLSPGYVLFGTSISPYSAISQPISGLGLGITGPFMNAAFIASGALVVAGVIVVFVEIERLGTAGRWLCDLQRFSRHFRCIMFEEVCSE